MSAERSFWIRGRFLWYRMKSWCSFTICSTRTVSYTHLLENYTNVWKDNNVGRYFINSILCSALQRILLIK